MRRGIQKRLGQANRLVGRRYGFAIDRYPTNALDRELQRIISTYDLSTVIDVGAHVGGFGTRLRALGFSGKIVSFEPFATSYRKLVNSASTDDRWETRCIALGSQRSTDRIHAYSGDGQFNSLRSLSDHARSYAPDIESTGSSDVQVERLDEVWHLLGADARSSLLKVDTQGYDLEVVAGAGDLLAEFPAALCEVAVEPIYEGAPNLEEMVAAMRAFGFELTGAFPIHRYDDGIRVIEFDCTFCNVTR